MFAPVVLTWFISIGLIGVYNIVSNDPSVFRALNPLYIISYFHRNKVEAWKSLGGIVLCITGKCLDKIFELCSVWCALLKLTICALLYLTKLFQHKCRNSCSKFNCISEIVFWR
jgi:KUP system potassium uptake protein